MTSENQSNLRFSVEESVWFQKGQEVSSLLSISLDPDIVIQEHDQYVSIRGALLLNGEYKIEEQDSDEEAPDYTSVRFVNEVRTREDGISELTHKFPVDITIPRNRIQSLEEVYVTIESFDYEIPKRGCLQIVADLSISGIHGTTKSKQEEPKENDEPIVAVQPRNEEPIETQVEEELELVRSSSEDEQVENEVALEEELVLHRNANVDEDEEGEDEVDDGLFVPFEVEARKEAYQEPEVEVEQDVVKAATPQFEVKTRSEIYKIFNSNETKNATVVEERQELAASSKPADEVVEEETHQVSKRNENELTLTKIFAKNDTDEHMKMKICIVQNGDSLDKIAERYEISVQQLIRVNSLAPDHIVSEGELLYIPSKHS